MYQNSGKLADRENVPTRRKLTRRQFLKLGGGLAALPVAAPLLSSCGGSQTGQSTSGSGETLVVASWKNYGADDPWALKTFEESTGAKVENVYFTSEAGLLRMLRQGGLGKIDVVLPNLQYVPPAIDQDLLQPIDPARITTWNNLQENYRNLDVLRANDELYAVPWVQGATSLAVNPEQVQPSPNSWEVLWASESKGKVGFFDDPSTAVMTTALYLGEDPHNPNLDNVREALVDLKPNVQVYWASADDWNKAYNAGSLTMGNLWSGLAGTLQTDDIPVDFILPEQGFVRWADTWAIAKDAPHLELAYEWINFLTSREYFTHWIEEPGENQQLALPVNSAAVTKLSEGAKENLVANKLTNYEGPTALQGGVPLDRVEKWTSLWQEVKAS